MRVFITLVTLVSFSLQIIADSDLLSLQDLFTLDLSSDSNKMSPTNITEEEFLKNIFLKANVAPSLITTTLTLACFLASIKLQNVHLKDIKLKLASIGLEANFTTVLLKSIECEDAEVSGIIPVNEHTADLVLPKINARLTFNYSINFGHDRPETGNGSIDIQQLAWQGRFETYQGEIEHQPEGPVRATLHSNTFNFTKMDGEFSDIYTQTEWDVLFEKPAQVKELVELGVGYVIKKLFHNLDLRQLINITFGKGVNLLFGITSPITYDPTGEPAPNDRSMDVKMHSIVTMPKGQRVEGLFTVDMQAKPLSYNYTSLIFNTDILNKVLSATTSTESISVSFNQKTLDDIKFTLLTLNTTALKPFFPSLEPMYGQNLGVYIKAYLPQYDNNRCYFKVSGGIIVAVLAAQLELYVTRDQATYYNSSLEECLAKTTCIKANTIEMDMYIKLPMSFTTDKQLALGFMDVEITNVIVSPATFDPDMLRVKLNNFVDISLPHLLKPIDLSLILAPFLVSVDALEDQRIALAIGLDQ